MLGKRADLVSAENITRAGDLQVKIGQWGYQAALIDKNKRNR